MIEEDAEEGEDEEVKAELCTRGLHVAIQNQRMEMAWVMLFLASNLVVSYFLGEVIQSAQNSGLQRMG